MKRRLIPVIHEWPGYTGKFIRDQAFGAISNGQRVTKINSVPGDDVADGALGVVIGSIDVVAAAPCLAGKYTAEYLYFVEWDDRPTHIAGVRDYRVRQLS